MPKISFAREALIALVPVAALAGATSASAAQGSADTQHKPAVDASLKLTAEPVALLAGGKRSGIYSAQQIELNLNFDWGKIASLKGLSSHVTFVNRNGENASLKLLGDNLFQSQAIYGGTQHAPVHLVQAYLEYKTRDTKLDLAGGRLPVGEAFATSPLYCEFMNTAVCGYPYALGAKQGFSTFPNSTWGARVKYSPDKHVYIQTGAYEVRPRAGGRWGFDWGWSGTTGTYVPIEVGWEPKLGGGSLPGHYKLGAGLDTSSYPDNFEDRFGNSFAISGLPPRRHGSRYSLYLLADQMLARHGKGDEDGLVLFGGLVHSQRSNSQISGSGFVGFLDTGVIESRPKDSVGLVFSYAKISPSAVETQWLQQARGLPLLYAAKSVQSHEALVELRYDAAVGSHLHVMPDLQYVIRPGATHTRRNGLLAGLRLTAKF